MADGQDGGEAGSPDAHRVEGGGVPPSPANEDGSAGDGGVAGETGSGALCGVNGRNACGPLRFCDPPLGCVDCVTDGDCPAAAPRCLVGACVGCRPEGGEDAGGGATPPTQMTNCPPSLPSCWTTNDACHAACGAAVACPEATLCDTVSGACVGCRSDADCPGGVCDGQRRICVTCRDDTTCPANHPRCRVLTGTCEACLSNADCGHAAPICDPLTFSCRVGCDTDAQCETGAACDPGTALCVTVQSDAGTDAKPDGGDGDGG